MGSRGCGAAGPRCRRPSGAGGTSAASPRCTSSACCPHTASFLPRVPRPWQPPALGVTPAVSPPSPAVCPPRAAAAESAGDVGAYCPDLPEAARRSPKPLSPFPRSHRTVTFVRAAPSAGVGQGSRHQALPFCSIRSPVHLSSLRSILQNLFSPPHLPVIETFNPHFH